MRYLLMTNDPQQNQHVVHAGFVVDRAAVDMVRISHDRSTDRAGRLHRLAGLRLYLSFRRGIFTPPDSALRCGGSLVLTFIGGWHI